MSKRWVSSTGCAGLTGRQPPPCPLGLQSKPVISSGLPDVLLIPACGLLYSAAVQTESPVDGDGVARLYQEAWRNHSEAGITRQRLLLEQNWGTSINWFDLSDRLTVDLCWPPLTDWARRQGGPRRPWGQVVVWGTHTAIQLPPHPKTTNVRKCCQSRAATSNQSMASGTNCIDAGKDIRVYIDLVFLQSWFIIDFTSHHILILPLDLSHNDTKIGQILIDESSKSYSEGSAPLEFHMVDRHQPPWLVSHCLPKKARLKNLTWDQGEISLPWSHPFLVSQGWDQRFSLTHQYYDFCFGFG